MWNIVWSSTNYFHFIFVSYKTGQKNRKTKWKRNEIWLLHRSYSYRFYGNTTSILLRFKFLLMPLDNLKNTPWTQDVNWRWIKNAEDVQDIFRTSYIPLNYVLCPGGVQPSVVAASLFFERTQEEYVTQ